MNIKIYQINLDRDKNGVAFESYESISKFQDSDKVDAELYDKVFDGAVEAQNLEDVYLIFNIDKPEDYHGRSLSVSDVVEITESESEKPGCYYCDCIGFKGIDFDTELCNESKSNTITVVMCEPGKKAYVTEVRDDPESLQAAVGGLIEAYYPFESNEAIVCNDEGKFNGMSPCRGINDDKGELMDIIFGKFFICDCSGESFGSLSEDKQKEYLAKFDNPERFFRVNGEVKAVKYEP